MFNTIRLIGELVDEPEVNINGKVFAINLDTIKKNIEVEIEDFNSSKVGKYLFLENEQKGGNGLPFCSLTEPRKAYQRVKNWLKKCKKIKFNNEEHKSFTKQVFDAVSSNKDEIINKVTQKINEALYNEDRRFLTIKIDNKYLGEYDIFQRCFRGLQDAKLKRSSETASCSVCKTTGIEVSGKVNVFRFYTIDKPGFITGTFKESDAWKNCPICWSCGELLRKGKRYIEENLSFKFYGLEYYLIPQMLNNNGQKYKQIIDILSDAPKNVSLKKRIVQRLTDDEREVLEYFSDGRDFVNLNLLFLSRQQSAERILLLIEDVLPSHIRRIFDAKSYIDNLFKHEFNFGKIREFFYKSNGAKRNRDLDKYFLEIVNSVFTGKTINFSFLVKFYMLKIRSSFVNDENFNTPSIHAFMSTLFLENLGIIKFKEERMSEGSKFNDFFCRYGKSLNTSAKRGIFLLGVLTQLLLNKQFKELKSKPFLKKLKGLKMNDKDIKGLLPQIQNKFEEYDAYDFGKKEIACEISRYLLSGDDNWRMSIDEINFYFVCGMSMYKEITSIIYGDQANEKEEE